MINQIPATKSIMSASERGKKMTKFKKGWRDAIALPDNLADLAYTLASKDIPQEFARFYSVSLLTAIQT
jgi:hypothetical protein